MGDKTEIQWTEATWNPVAGCTIVSPGCTHCYAMGQAARIVRMGGKAAAKYEGLTDTVKGRAVWNGRVRLVPEALDQPLRWRRPRTIFVNSMSDLFHEGVPDHYIDKVFRMMAAADHHRYQVLTKRAERMQAYCSAPDIIRRLGTEWPLRHVWLGVSAEDQTRWDERVERLGATPAAVRFVSAEPLLGPIDVGNALDPPPIGSRYRPIDWVIVGGESGPRARTMELEWAQWLVEQCELSGVPVFMKQLGQRATLKGLDYPTPDRKGGKPEEWPAELRVREMPA